MQDTFLDLRKQIIEKEFARMNDMQKQAIFHTEGPLLILAGAGSGKTSVLVSRIATIVKCDQAQPWQILAITFTNKATTIPIIVSNRRESVVINGVSSKSYPIAIHRNVIAARPAASRSLMATVEYITINTPMDINRYISTS